MTENEWLLKNNSVMDELMKNAIINPPKTQKEKDIYNLKYLLYSLRSNGMDYLVNKIKTLNKVIKMLEAQNDKN